MAQFSQASLCAAAEKLASRMGPTLQTSGEGKEDHAGAAHDLGVNYAPKLANIGISCPACVQTVTLSNPTPQANPFGPGLISFAGAPDFSPTRIATPGGNV
jgi:hypothetical protein